MAEFLSKFQGGDINFTRVNSIRVTIPLIFYNILCAISLQVMSSWAIVFFELSVRIPYFVSYTLVTSAMLYYSWRNIPI